MPFPVNGASHVSNHATHLAMVDAPQRALVESSVGSPQLTSPAYAPDARINSAVSQMHSGTAFANLEPRSPITNKLIKAAAKLLPTDVGQHITRYAEPLGIDFDGTALYPRLTGTESGAAIGALLDRHARTHKENPITPALSTGAHELITQMFPAGTTQLQRYIVDDTWPWSKTLGVMAENSRRYGNSVPSATVSTTSPHVAQTAGILAHLALNPRVYELLNQRALNTTVIGGRPFDGSDDSPTFVVKADSKASSRSHTQDWDDDGTVNIYDTVTLPPGATYVEIPRRFFEGQNKFTFSALMGGASGHVTSDAVSQFLAAMQRSRDANNTGQIGALSAYLGK